MSGYLRHWDGMPVTRISHDGPVRLTQTGVGWVDPIMWTIQPCDFGKLVEFLNSDACKFTWKLEGI